MGKNVKFLIGLCLVILASCEVSTSVSLFESSSESESSSEESFELNSFPTYEYEDLFTKKVVHNTPGENDPHITLEKTEFTEGEMIVATPHECNVRDSVELYPYGGYPVDMTDLAHVSISGEDPVELKATMFEGEHRYLLYLCRSAGAEVLQCIEITIKQKLQKDYAPASAKYSYVDGEMLVDITPGVLDKQIYYEIYWAKDGVRLEDYSRIILFKKKASEEFTVSLGKNLIMPNEANQIEIFPITGTSHSIFVPANNQAKLRKSNYLYSFNVYTDMHVEDYTTKSNHVDHLQTALNDAYCYNRNSKALISNGDQTNVGCDAYWKTVTGLLNTYKEKVGCPIYYTVGNHEYFYCDLTMFKKYTETTGYFYTKQLEGSTCIFMGSDEITTMGEIHDEHIDWLKEQLDAADKTKPIYVFLHQPLSDTVSGSYRLQGWYLIDSTNKIKNLLANYDNTFFFSGHTHWQMESKNNIQVNETGTTYINCASVGYLWNDSNVGEPGSEGLFVDVYEDKIVFKGRDFVYGKWLSYANYVVPFTNAINF